MRKGLVRGCLIGIGIILGFSVLSAMVRGGSGATSGPTAVAGPRSTATIVPTEALAATSVPEVDPTDVPLPIATVRPTLTRAPVEEPVATAPAAPVVAPGSDSYPCAVGQVKGNRDSKIYHVPGGTSYARTQENVRCFATEADARAAGYRAAKT